MFWSAVLPFQITCVVLAVGCAAGIYLAPRAGVKRRLAAALLPAAAVLAFVPFCLGINVVSDAVRFGESRHATADGVDAPEVARWLPPAATEIDVHRYATGFEARYAIGGDDLRAWVDAERARWGGNAADERRPPEPAASPYGGPLFRWADWPTPDDLIWFDGPHAANGAGFTIWYSPSEGRAYQTAGYW